MHANETVLTATQAAMLRDVELASASLAYLNRSSALAEYAAAWEAMARSLNDLGAVVDDTTHACEAFETLLESEPPPLPRPSRRIVL